MYRLMRMNLRTFFVKKLSLMYRLMLEQKVDQLSDLENEQTVIGNYFFLQKVRFEEKLSWVIK
mgnify:CR=1 FL=1